MPGITSTGFETKSLETILAEITAALKIEFGDSLNTDPATSALGRILNAVAAPLAELWQLGQALFSSIDPRVAEVASLDNLSAITGIQRRGSTRSTVTLTLTGTPTTLVVSGSLAEVEATGAQFRTTADATIALANAWAAATTYVVGDKVSSNGNIYRVTAVSGPSAVPAPIGESTHTDGAGNTYRFLGEGTGFVDVAAEGTIVGPLVGNSGDITTIITPTSGWSGVFNVLDATLGRESESDAALRIRRVVSLAQPAGSAQPGLEAALSAVPGVVSARIFQNRTDETDSDGLAPHSVRAVVRGGVNADILQALFDNVATGIETNGAISGNVIDAHGRPQLYRFDRTTEINIFVAITLIKDPTAYPADGDDQVKAAIVAFGDTLTEGRDVVSAAVSAQCFEVAGVLDVTLAAIGLSASPVSEVTIPIDLDELALFDTSRITVTTSDGVP